ncbi:hypothetical protein D9M71_395750 [compost metagenome]
MRVATAKHQLATALVELVHGRGIEHVGDIGVAEVEPPLWPLQGHAELAVAGFPGRLAERCRQVDGQAFETGVDPELIVTAAQVQSQLIRQLSRQRQGLLDLQPLGQGGERHLALGLDPRLQLTGFALGKDLRGNRLVEYPCADVLAAEALAVVEAERALELVQLDHRGGDFQTCIAGVEIHHHLRLLALGQGDIQLELALEATLTFPACEQRSSADRRFLEDFQAIAQAAIECSIQVHMRVLTTGNVGNVDLHIADLGIEQLSAFGIDAHTIIVDVHITIDLLHLRPARLEVERGIMDLEKQADAARLFGCTVIERALVLEITFVDRALENGGTQPFIQRWAEDFGKVLGGVATIAIDQADTQVHVVFTCFIE